jgi:polysaccharide biosynthesis transport protein
MLQRANEHSLSAAEPGPAPSEQLAEILDFCLGLIRRQYITVLSCLALGMIAGGVYLFITPPRYSASALVMMDARTGQFLPDRSIVGDTPINSPWIDSQITVISSDDLLASVVKTLKLDADPQFKDSRSLLRRWFFDLFQEGNADSAERRPESELIQEAVAVLQHNLEVNRVGMSYVIEIRVRAGDSDRAAVVANAIADAYLRDLVTAKSQASRRATDWLQERLQTLREQSAAAEQAIVWFKTKNNIVAADGKLINEQQLADLTTRLVAARASTSEAEARLHQIEAVLKSDLPDSTISAVADSLSNPIITKLRTQYLELVNREADWAARYGSKHSAVTKLRDQIQDLRRSIQSELRRIAESYKSEYAIAKKRQSELEGRVTTLIAQSQETNQAQITLRSLESTAQSYRALYDNFLRRYTEAQQAFPNSEARVISAALPPHSASHPRKLRVAAIAIFGGLALGFGLALFRELMDRVFRTSRQVHAAVGTECVAMVPQLRARTSIMRLERNLPGDIPRLMFCNSNAARTVINSPVSPFAEAIRSIKVAADLTAGLTQAKVIGIVSSVPGEGKSTVAMALGELVAQTGARVALVDCDVRNPSLSRSLAPKAKIGLLDVVLGSESLEDAIWTDADTGMAFIPCVLGPHLPHPSEILVSNAMKSVFQNLRSSYDYIIVDLSPLAAAVDARLTARFIDAYVMVVKWGRTKIDVVQCALDDAQAVQDRLLGVALNQVDFRRLSRYGDHRAKHYYGTSSHDRAT